MNFFVSDLIKLKESIIAHFTKELHLIKKLKVKVLINMNILNLKKINVFHSKQKIVIFSYNDFVALLIITLKK